MEQRFLIEELKEHEWKIWDEWLQTLPYSSPFSTSWWLRAVCNIFGGIPHIYIIKNSKEKFIGGIGLREIKVFNKYIVSPSTLSLYMPFVVSEDLNHRELIEVEKEFGIFLGNIFDIINITNTNELYDIRGFKWINYEVDVNYTAILNLTAFSFDFIDRAEKKQIKKSERELMKNEPCDDIEIMYSLWCKTFNRQGLKAPVSLSQIRYLYKIIKSQNAGQGFVTFDKDRNPASFRICLWNNLNKVYDWIAGTDPNYFKVGSSAFNLYSTLVYLKETGFSNFDFCGANIETIANFKLSFGAKLVPYYCIKKNPFYFKIIYPLRNVIKNFLRRKY